MVIRSRLIPARGAARAEPPRAASLPGLGGPRAVLAAPDDLAGFRLALRRLVAERADPAAVDWAVEPGAAPEPGAHPPLRLPAAFAELAGAALCHADEGRFAGLHRLALRVERGERRLLEVATDPLVHRLGRMAQAVRREVHKMHAFVRFRRVTAGEERGKGPESARYVAYFEPAHHVLNRAAPFFAARFASLDWSILTPLGSLHHDAGALALGPPAARADLPAGEDPVEALWRLYYRTTFNPARLGTAAMTREMPCRYWPLLPEGADIAALVAGAGRRAEGMVAAEPRAPRAAIPAPHLPSLDAPEGEAPSLDDLAAQVRACRRCPLHCHATQGVPGEGPADARVVLVGEQPGDQEDLAGRPFVGPAGQLLDRALKDAGLRRDGLRLTNAVKHFKFEARAGRRIHARPSASEQAACRPFLERELDLVAPSVVVALGATAARAVTGLAGPVGALRGRPIGLAPGRSALVTGHPSHLLRLGEGPARDEGYARLVADLARARETSDA